MTQTCQSKVATALSSVVLSTDCRHSFTVTLRRKLSANFAIKIPPHLNHVATLPCEIFGGGTFLINSPDCFATPCVGESEFEAIEGDDREDGHGGYDPGEWNVALGDDADEHGEQYEQEEVEHVEYVRTSGVDELLGRERLMDSHRRPLINLLTVELSTSH